jgi:hypothetical protein
MDHFELVSEYAPTGGVLALPGVFGAGQIISMWPNRVADATVLETLI